MPAPLATSNIAPLSNIPRVVFFDLDGTLVNSSGEISEACRHTVRNLNRRKIKASLASGRPYFAARDIIQDLNISVACMFFSGALLVDAGSGEILDTHAVEPSSLVEVVQYCTQHEIYCELYTEQNYFVSTRSHLTDIHAEYLGKHADQADLRTVLNEERILKVVLVIDNNEHPHVPQKLEAVFGDLTFATGYGASHPHITFVNITSPNSTREAAFHRLLQIFDIDRTETMAFGDADGDIPFLQLAGCGVAMGNAPQVVQRAADFVTRSVDQQGVAFAFEKLLPE